MIFPERSSKEDLLKFKISSIHDVGIVTSSQGNFVRVRCLKDDNMHITKVPLNAVCTVINRGVSIH